MDFSDYSARDFVLDEFFQEWILDPDEKTTAFWEDWIAENPDKADVVDEARQVIQNIKKVIERNIACDRDEIWQRLTNRE